MYNKWRRWILHVIKWTITNNRFQTKMKQNDDASDDVSPFAMHIQTNGHSSYIHVFCSSVFSTVFRSPPWTCMYQTALHFTSNRKKQIVSTTPAAGRGNDNRRWLIQRCRYAGCKQPYIIRHSYTNRPATKMKIMHLKFVIIISYIYRHWTWYVVFRKYIYF